MIRSYVNYSTLLFVSHHILLHCALLIYAFFLCTMYLHARVYVYVFMLRYMCVCVCICVCMCMYVCIYVHMYLCVCMCIYIYIYTIYTVVNTSRSIRLILLYNKIIIDLQHRLYILLQFI